MQLHITWGHFIPASQGCLPNFWTPHTDYRRRKHRDDDPIHVPEFHDCHLLAGMGPGPGCVVELYCSTQGGPRSGLAFLTGALDHKMSEQNVKSVLSYLPGVQF